MNLSVNIMTCSNEFLEMTLNSVKPYADEIIVKDTSTLFHLGEPWTNSSLDVRLTEILNEMKNESKGKWILKIDDDEIWPKEVMNEISWIARNSETTPIYAVPFLHIGKDTKLRYIKRLFRNIPEITWDGIFGTETLAYNGKRIPSLSCPQLKNFFIHLGGLRKNIKDRKHDYDWKD